MAKGIERRLDDLGRITLPKENRTVLGMVVGEAVDIYLDDEVIKVKLFDEAVPKGIKRFIDDLGRICLPKEYRSTLNIQLNDKIDMYLDGQVICLKPITIHCACCKTTDEDRLLQKDGVHICTSCIREMWQEVMKG